MVAQLRHPDSRDPERAFCRALGCELMSLRSNKHTQEHWGQSEMLSLWDASSKSLSICSVCSLHAHVGCGRGLYRVFLLLLRLVWFTWCHELVLVLASFSDTMSRNKPTVLASLYVFNERQDETRKLWARNSRKVRLCAGRTGLRITGLRHRMELRTFLIECYGNCVSIKQTTLSVRQVEQANLNSVLQVITRKPKRVPGFELSKLHTAALISATQITRVPSKSSTASDVTSVPVQQVFEDWVAGEGEEEKKKKRHLAPWKQVPRLRKKKKRRTHGPNKLRTLGLKSMTQSINDTRTHTVHHVSTRTG